MLFAKQKKINELEADNRQLKESYSNALRETRVFREKLEALEAKQKESWRQWDLFTPILREINGQKVWFDRYGYILSFDLGKRYTDFSSLVKIVVEQEELAQATAKESAEREKIAKIVREECFAAPKTKKKSGK